MNRKSTTSDKVTARLIVLDFDVQECHIYDLSEEMEKKFNDGETEFIDKLGHVSSDCQYMIARPGGDPIFWGLRETEELIEEYERENGGK